ncbi:MAG: hypothetical protein ACRYFR_14585 [Janthinobacterium lividum]
MLESISQVATIAGVIGLGFAFLALRQSRASFHQTVIVSCTNRFQKLSPHLKVDSPTNKFVQQYIELCNEELFYFENEYLPQAIIDEWLEGMLYFIGLWRGKELLFLPGQPENCPQSESEGRRFATQMHEEAKKYPRLCQAFTISADAKQRIEYAPSRYPEAKSTDDKSDVMRAQMVLEVLTNLSAYEQKPFYTYLRRMRADAW